MSFLRPIGGTRMVRPLAGRSVAQPVSVAQQTAVLIAETVEQPAAGESTSSSPTVPLILPPGYSPPGVLPPPGGFGYY